MRTFEFDLLVLQNIGLYSIALIITLLIYYFVYYKYIYSIFDPLNIHLISSALGFTSVLFMFSINSINFYYFSSYIITQTAFFIGFCILKPISENTSANKPYTIRYGNEIIDMIYFLSGFAFISSLLITYLKIGIPVLLESRLETYSTGGGIGIFGRIIEVTSPIILTIFFLKRFVRKRSNYFILLFDSILIISVLIQIIFSGSKGGFLIFLFTFFYTAIFSKTILKNDIFTYVFKKKAKNLFFIALLFVFIPTFIQKSDFSPILRIIVRLVNSGDIYIMSYPNEVLENIPKDNAFKALFSNVLSMYRVFPRESLPKPLGNILFEYHHKLNLLLGPNARHNVFGLHYLGYYKGIIFSFLLGFLVSFFRNKILFYLPSDGIGILLFVLLNIIFNTLEGDPVYAINRLNNIMLIAGILLIAAYIIVIFSKNRIIGSNEKIK